MTRNRVPVFVLIVMMLALPLLDVGRADAQGAVHVVQPGETLYAIAQRYGVSPGAIVSANGLLNPNFIYVGQRLTIPQGTPTPGGGVHIVQRGETLYAIARRYGVEPQAIINANGLLNPNRLLVGQQLIIPGTASPTPSPTPTSVPQPTPTPVPRPTRTPTPQPTPTPTPSPTPVSECPIAELITIDTPTQGTTIGSPFTVTGLGVGFEGNLAVKVLDETGFEIGSGYATIASGGMGEQGPYIGVISFTVPHSAQMGRVQVYSVSPRDGAIEHLASVSVKLQGTGLDERIAALKAALERKSYAALLGLLPAEGFLLGLYQSEGLVLTAAELVDLLEEEYLGPGEVFVDFSVDARELLGDRVALGEGIRHVLFSTGWGEEQADDAFLFIGEDEGRAVWSGMLYVPGELRDYPLP
ncbi:MAG: LysM peptidoglycan-binding domain-containing protein [Chloroflexi bacterium]|nr:LysM peptidoglycan-binding domain-containing protein [Chloroflexota bacterium]